MSGRRRHSKDAQEAGVLSSTHFPEMETGRRQGHDNRQSRFGEETGEADVHFNSANDVEKVDPEGWDDEKHSAAADSDDPFAAKGENDVQYRTMEWWCVFEI